MAGSSSFDPRYLLGVVRTSPSQFLWFVYRRVHPRVALLEILYRDGDVSTTKAVDGYVLYAVPARHAREGHRVTVVVARDASDKEVGRQDFRKR